MILHQWDKQGWSGFSPGFLPQARDIWWTGNSKLTWGVNVSVYGCLSLYVSLAMSRRPVQGGPWDWRQLLQCSIGRWMNVVLWFWLYENITIHELFPPRCPCWRLWLSLWRTNIPLYPPLLRLWIVSSTKGQDMITDTLFRFTRTRPRKTPWVYCGFGNYFRVDNIIQTWGIQRVFELIGTRIRSWIFPPFYSGSFVPETMNVRSEVFIPQHISQVQTTSVFEALD